MQRLVRPSSRARNLVGCLVLSTVVARAAGAQGGPPSALLVPHEVVLTEAVSVPMQLTERGRPSIAVTINGHGPYLLSIETGGPFGVLLPARLAGELQLAAPPNPPGPAARWVDSLQVGGLTLRGMVAVTRDSLALPGVDGLLGLATFHDLVVTLDYPRRRVRFQRDSLPAPNGRDILPLHPASSSRLLAVDATVDGQTLPLVLDTQSGGIQLLCDPNAARLLTPAAPPVTIGQAAVAGLSPVDMQQIRYDGTIRLGRYALERPMVLLMPLPTPTCLMGSELLAHFAVTLDQRSQRVRFEAKASVVPEPPPSYTIGASFTAAAGDPAGYVASPAAGGAAAEAGLMDGDEVVTVGGRAPGPPDPPALLVDPRIRSGKPVRLVVRRRGRLVVLTITPRMLVR